MLPLFLVVSLNLLSPTSLADAWLPSVELYVVLSGISFAVIDRITSFFVRAMIHLMMMFYFFLFLMPFRAFGPFFPDSADAIIGSMGLWILIMFTQFAVTCPRCNALYSLVYCSENSNNVFSWSTMYAPWVTPKCEKCGRDKMLPHDLEREYPEAVE